MEEICADETGKSQEAVDVALGGMGQAKQQEGDESDDDLDTHGVLGSSEEVFDLEGLLDSAEEQLDLPAVLVEVSDLLCRGGKIIGEDAHHFAGLDLHAELAQGIW